MQLFRYVVPGYLWIILSAFPLGILASSGCTSASSSGEVMALQTAPPVATNTPPVQTTATSTPDFTPTPAGPTTLVIWWPEPLAPRENADAAEVLSEQISAFERANATVEVQFRLKAARDVGGIMQTLRSASAVAPGALPDITLLRREDLLAAAQAGLIQPMENQIAPTILGDLYTASVALGQVEQQFYGVPYMLEIQHMAYRSSDVPINSWRLSDFLRERFPFAFAAGRATGVSDVFWVQYLAAGGTVPTNGELTLNIPALRSTLSFYEQAANRGLINASVLDYTSSTDLAVLLAGGEIDAAVINSGGYLNLLNQGQRLDFGPIPTQDGQPATYLNGWLWVMVSSNPEKQTLAATFINSMLEVEMQGQYSQAIHMLPSQRSALRQWADESYAEFINDQLANATLPLPENIGGTAARAMQDALRAVLTGEQNAEEAVQDVVDQLAN
jgi:ABC-type glycerol-3-phosphate transport system substrate-binding protein